jgi:hypothetical protein
MFDKFCRMAVYRELPSDIRAHLNKRIFAGEIDDVLRAWCQEQGYPFNRSAFSRYTKRVRDNQDAMLANCRVAEDEPLSMDAITRELGAIEREIHALRLRKTELLQECEIRKRNRAD